MFGLFGKSANSGNQLWLINLHIGRGTNTDMPANLIGAYVPVFVAAPNHEAAAMEAVSQVTRRGYEFLDISDKKIHQLDATKWHAYVHEAWPEFSSHFPTQEEVIAGLPQGKMFFGPFAGYEAAPAQQGAEPDAGESVTALQAAAAARVS